MVMSSWLQSRRTRITATDAASILGVGFETPYAVWAAKTGRAPEKDLDSNEAIYWGGRLESIVIQECELRSGRRVISDRVWSPLTRAVIERHMHKGVEKLVLVHPDVPLLACTPDSVIQAWKPLPNKDEQVEHEGPGVLEAKTAGQFMAADWEDGVPLKYQIQVQVQLMVTGWSWGCVPVLIGGRDFRMYDVPRNDAFCSQLLDTLMQWWNDHVVEDVAPAVSGDDDDLLKAMYPNDSGATIVLPETWARHDEKLERWNQHAKRANDRVKELKAQLKAAIGDASYAAIEGTAVMYSYKTTPRAGYTVEPSTTRPLKRESLGKAKKARSRK